MESLHQWQQVDPLRFRRLGFKIQRSGARDAARVSKFFEYAGADESTKCLLSTNAERWTEEPHSFWLRPEPSTTFARSASPAARLVAFYINTKYDDA